MNAIQEQIDARISRIEAVLSDKLGRAVKIDVKYERTSHSNPSFSIWSWAGAGKNLCGYKCTSLDEAFDVAMLTALGTRSIDDENADLGIASLRGDQEREVA